MRSKGGGSVGWKECRVKGSQEDARWHESFGKGYSYYLTFFSIRNRLAIRFLVLKDGDGSFVHRASLVSLCFAFSLGDIPLCSRSDNVVRGSSCLLPYFTVLLNFQEQIHLISLRYS